MNIVQALASPKLFAPFFVGASWESWKVALAALFGLKMSEQQQALYRECTGRTELPTKPCREAAFVVGRRGGKSRALALLGLYVGCFIDHAPYLAAGETAVVVIICPSRSQSRVVVGYIMGLLRAIPALTQMIQAETAESVTLSNRCRIEVGTASYKSSRGY